MSCNITLLTTWGHGDLTTPDLLVSAPSADLHPQADFGQQLCSYVSLRIAIGSVTLAPQFSSYPSVAIITSCCS